MHWPRHHVVARDTLLVAGQLSDEVVSLGIDLRTGVPGRVRHRTARALADLSSSGALTTASSPSRG